MMFFLHQCVGVLSNPSMVFVLGLIGGLVLLRRRIGKIILLLDLCVSWICSMPVTTEKLAKWIESDYYPVKSVQDLPQAEAIILLGGGVWAPPEGSPWPYPDLKESADRAWHAARLYHAGKAPKICCTCPDVSRSTPPFLRDLGVPEEAIVPLDGPRNTEEEARLYQKKLTGDRKDRVPVLLVTSASHMKRATRIFSRYAPGLEVVPAAIDFMYIEPVKEEFEIRRYLPNAGCLSGFGTLLHELLGLVRYAL